MKTATPTAAGSATRRLFLLLPGLIACLLLALPVVAAPTRQDEATAIATADGRPTTAAEPAVATPEAADVTPTATPIPPEPEPQFGVIESFEDPSAATRLGVGWTRARFHWAEVQPDGPDDWQPPLDDETLAAELDAGREVVGLLIGIPDWARDRSGLPSGLALPPDDPDNLWAVYVNEVVGRYAGRIDRWIIWNEPDIADEDAPGHTWDGDLDDFVALQRASYLAAREASPEAIIHLPAFTYFWDPGYFDRFLDRLMADPDAAANDYYFDVATAHLYFQPNAVYNVLHAYGRVLADHGLDKPIWLVETNAPPMNDPYWVVPNWTLAVTLNEQAAFIPQALAAALAAGAERVAVYKLKDTEDDRAANPEPFGLIRWDDSRRPAYDTYRVAIRYLRGATAAERERWDAVGQVRLNQEDQTTTVLFARLPGSQTARVPATAATAEWIDMWGRRETIEAQDGYFDVTLPGALCTQTIADYCMIGGTTYYLVQARDEAFLAGLPTASPTDDSRQTTAAEATVVATSTPRPTRPAPTATTASPTATPTMPTVAPTATVGPPTATLSPAAVVAPVDVTPVATQAAGLAGNEEPASETAGGWRAYTGLIVIGLGLALGVALLVWRATRQRPDAAQTTKKGRVVSDHAPEP